MIYTTCLMCYATFSHKQKAPIPLFLGIFLVALALFITLYYHYLQDPLFHQNMFALLTVTVVFRAIYVMEKNVRPRIKSNGDVNGTTQKVNAVTKEQKQEQQRQADRDAKILKTMWVLIACGLTIFLVGFGVWNLDNIYCSTLRRWRRQVGLPWGILLEGHGWWSVGLPAPNLPGSISTNNIGRHLMTGTGAYFYITWGIWLRHCLNGRQDEFELVWPNVFTLPAVQRVKPETTKQNDVAKKNA